MKHLAPLTSLRFFAALAIVLHHVQGFWGTTRNPTSPLPQAVSFFFVLSGFLLATLYPELPTPASRRRFLRARFARVWPLHATAFLLLFVVLPNPGRFGTNVTNGWLALLNISLLHAWFPMRNVYASYDAISWTVSTEFAFYLLFPLLIRQFYTTWWWKLLASGALGLGLAWSCRQLGLPLQSPDSWDVTSRGVVFVNPLARLFEFVLGMSIALLRPRLLGWLRTHGAIATAAETASLAMAAIVATTIGGVADRWVETGWISEPLALWLRSGGVSCFAFALLVLVFGCQAGRVSRILSLRIFVTLGGLSYAIYLLHTILLRYLMWRVSVFAGVPVWLQVVGFGALLLALSFAAAVVIEQPMRAWIRGTPRATSAVAARMLPLDLVIIAGLVASILVQVHRAPDPRPVLAAEAFAVSRARTAEAIRDVHFGGAFILRGAVLSPEEDGWLLDLVWEPLAEFPRDTLVAVHVVDSSGRILLERDYLQDGRAMSSGHAYLDRRILRGVPAEATRVAIAVRPPDAMAPLAVSKGPSDWQGRRLLLDIPR